MNKKYPGFWPPDKTSTMKSASLSLISHMTHRGNTICWKKLVRRRVYDTVSRHVPSNIAADNKCVQNKNLVMKSLYIRNKFHSKYSTKVVHIWFCSQKCMSRQKSFLKTIYTFPLIFCFSPFLEATDSLKRILKNYVVHQLSINGCGNCSYL